MMLAEQDSSGRPSESSGESADSNFKGTGSSELWSRYQSRNKRFSIVLKGGQLFLAILVLAAVFIALWIVVVR